MNYRGQAHIFGFIFTTYLSRYSFVLINELWRTFNKVERCFNSTERCNWIEYACIKSNQSLCQTQYTHSTNHEDLRTLINDYGEAFHRFSPDSFDTANLIGVTNISNIVFVVSSPTTIVVLGRWVKCDYVWAMNDSSVYRLGAETDK